jgi:hypothetical protein
MVLYHQECVERKRDLDYYGMKEPTEKVTFVNVPVYDGGEFNGVVEFNLRVPWHKVV